MRVSVVGTGYVGLVSGACLAEKGHRVTCVDIDAEKVRRINAGDPPIYEKGLEELLRRNVGKNLFATTDLEAAVHETELSIIAVGTPFDGAEIDLRYVKEVAGQIGRALRSKDDYHLVVVKSTVVPGTTEQVVLPALEAASGKRAGSGFGVGMNPEFLREGEAIADFMSPDRIVMGGIDERSLALQRELYEVFSSVSKLETNCRTAEMIKYTSNALLATMISFSNEIANLCSAVGGVDVVDVMRGVHLDKRLTPILPSGERVVPAFTTYLEAGCGFGGSCFPKDVNALTAFGSQRGQSMRLLESVMSVNATQYRQVLDRLYKHLPELEGVKVAVLGLAFKPGTDDMRESPAIPVINELLKGAAIVQAFDPIATHEARKLWPGGAVRFCETVAEAVSDADAVVVLTRWAEFNGLPELLAETNRNALVIDGRRFFDKGRFQRYEGIGL